MDDYIGSIAENNVNYIIQEVYNTNPGAQYQKVMLFVGEAEAASFFVGTPPTKNTGIEVNSKNYADLTESTLKLWLDDFFAGTQISTVWLVVWDDTGEGSTFSVDGLEAAYNANKTKAYFKMCISASHESAIFVELCTLAINDDLFTQCWLGTSDDTVAIVTSVLAVANADAKIVYHSDSTRNPALVQLGITLSTPNLDTGFCVGNSLFFLKNIVIDASGTAVSNVGTNITAVLRSTLEAAKVSFFTYIGDGTGSTAMEGNLTIRSKNAGAKWIEAFIEFVGTIKTAQKITEMNTWRNNDTYQAILLITQTLINQFVTLGRFQNAKITAPNFNNLPAGPSITVPNAWIADFSDAVSQVSIYGTLNIAMS
jgi:hypothetical protein